MYFRSAPEGAPEILELLNLVFVSRCLVFVSRYLVFVSRCLVFVSHYLVFVSRCLVFVSHSFSRNTFK